MHVEEREVARDDGDGESDEQHPPDGAQRADDAAADRRRRDVPVADGRHRDDAPPEADRDVGEGALLAELADALGVEYERGEDDHRNEEEDGEHHEFVAARAD